MSYKLIAFYSGTLVLVIGLFHAITSYGEKYLKTPATIAGHYISTAAPPDCAESVRLVLDLKQSGIYLNGAIALQDTALKPPSSQNPAQITTKLESSPPTLSGRWTTQQITLAGTAPGLMACSTQSSTQPISAQPIQLTGQMSRSPDATLTAQIIRGSQSWQFTATYQPLAESEKAH